MGEVLGRLFGGQVEVGEDDDPGDRMLEDLSSPAGVGPGVEPLAQLEAQPREHADHAGKEPPRAAERVMVVVGPAQAEAILAGLLHPGGRVARLPVVALDLEDQVARQVGRARQLDHALEGRLGRSRIPSSSSSNRRRRACQRSRAARASRAACGFIRPSRASSPGNGSKPR